MRSKMKPTAGSMSDKSNTVVLIAAIGYYTNNISQTNEDLSWTKTLQ